MIKRELHIFLTAVMFYTRIPCPKWVDHNPEYLSRATKYFPLIGWIVGTVYASTVLMLMLIYSPIVSILIGLAISILLTGAFHEDGFADVCDGFGGGWTKEKILAIMKDSRLGTYGVVGLLLLLALKISVTYELVTTTDRVSFLLMAVTAHAVSRAMPVIAIRFLAYARDESDHSKAKPVAAGISLANFMIAMIIAIIPLCLLLFKSRWYVGLSVIPILLVTLYLIWYFKKWINGYTGDCLGAIQQLTESMFLLSTLALWKFI